MDRIELIPPGEILVEEFLKPYELTQAKLARDLDIPQSRIAEIANGQRTITVDTAIRLSVYFKTSIHFWLNLQNAYDIEKAKRAGDYETIVLNIRQNPNCITA